MEPQSDDKGQTINNGRIGPEHQLESKANRVQRVAQHTQGLVEDIKDWVELKVELTKLEVWDQVEEKVQGLVLELQDKAQVIAYDVLEDNEESVRGVVSGVAVMVIGLVAYVFLGVAASLALEGLLDRPGLGFLIVAVAQLIIAGLIWAYNVEPLIKKVQVVIREKRHGKSIEQRGAPGEAEGHRSLDGGPVRSLKE